MLGISVILDPHSQIISVAPLASTVLKALNPQSHAALEASALTVENGGQQTVSSAQLDTSAGVSLCWCIWELGRLHDASQDRHPLQLYFLQASP